MSTQINLTIGDQRLLQANKTRTAANQQALDDRTASKQLEQKATEAAEAAAPEQRPGALPDTRTGRRPTAQRFGQKTGLLLFDNIKPKIVEDSSVNINNTNLQVSVQDTRFVSGNFVYSRAFVSTTNWLYYRTLNTSPIIYTFDSPQNMPTGIPTPQYLTSSDFNVYSVYYSTTSSSWRTKRQAVLRIGTGSAAAPQTFTDSLGAFPISTIASALELKTVVHSSTIDNTYVSYVIRYFGYNIGEYSGPAVANLSKPGRGSAISLTDTYIQASSATLNTLGIYFKTDHQTGITTYRTETLDTTVYPLSTTTINVFLPPGGVQPGLYPFTSQQQQNFVANMSVDDPRKIMYQQTNRLDYALDTAINGCMYNPDTGGMYVTAFDKNYENVFIAKATVDRGLTYATALLEQAKPAALAIKNNLADTVPTALTAPFTLYSQFINTLGPDTTFPAGLGKFYVMFGT